MHPDLITCVADLSLGVADSEAEHQRDGKPPATPAIRRSASGRNLAEDRGELEFNPDGRTPM